MAKQMWALRELVPCQAHGELKQQPHLCLPADRAPWTNSLEFCRQWRAETEGVGRETRCQFCLSNLAEMEGRFSASWRLQDASAELKQLYPFHRSTATCSWYLLHRPDSSEHAPKINPNQPNLEAGWKEVASECWGTWGQQRVQVWTCTTGNVHLVTLPGVSSAVLNDHWKQWLPRS